MSNLLEELKVILSDDLKNTNALLIYLNEEKEILVQSQFNKLPELAEKKQVLINQIEKNNVSKVTLLAPINQGNNSSKLLEVLANKYGVENTSELRRLNMELEEKLTLCRHQNAVNGQVIVRSLENNQELIDIVTGQAQKSQLYNSLGKSTDDTGTQSYHKEV
jgi:flagellar biosynthesis/type III secretory pathway chaperone